MKPKLNNLATSAKHVQAQVLQTLKHFAANVKDRVQFNKKKVA